MQCESFSLTDLAIYRLIIHQTHQFKSHLQHSYTFEDSFLATQLHFQHLSGSFRPIFSVRVHFVINNNADEQTERGILYADPLFRFAERPRRTRRGACRALGGEVNGIGLSLVLAEGMIQFFSEKLQLYTVVISGSLWQHSNALHKT